MTLARLAAGVCALLFGRQLFWLFVGVVGFALGMEVAARLFAGASTFVVLAAGLMAGIAGAILAQAAQELMIGVVGFVAGSYLGAQLLTAVMPYPGRNIWFALFGGGIVGVLLLNALFDWALIVLSSLVGAGFVVEAIQLSGQTLPLVYSALAIIGIVIQASFKRRRPSPPRI